jgi:hypothetical protein
MKKEIYQLTLIFQNFILYINTIGYFFTITNKSSNQSKGGIVFKVQICATQNNSEATKVAAEFNLTEEIESEMQDGWHKYTIGNFDTYEDAKNMREVKGNLASVPFIAAYYNGKRISVQEALMIRSQKLMK